MVFDTRMDRQIEFYFWNLTHQAISTDSQHDETMATEWFGMVILDLQLYFE